MMMTQKMALLTCMLGATYGCVDGRDPTGDDLTNSQLLADAPLGGQAIVGQGTTSNDANSSGGMNTFILSDTKESEDLGGTPDMPDIPDEPSPSEVVYEPIQRVFFEGISVANGYSDRINLELPDDVQSVTLIATGEQRFMLTIEHLEGPQGEILVAENPPGINISNRDRQVSPFPGPFLSPNRSASAGTGIGTLLAPNNPGVNVYGGTWQFSVGVLGLFGRTDATIDIEAVIKRAPQPQVRGTLDLHFFFTGARGWNANSAPTDTTFQAAVARMEEFYQPIGIQLGNFTYTDIAAEFREVDAGPMGPGPNMSKIQQMFALNTNDEGLAIFFVERIESGQVGGFIGGLAGGTPGPSLQGSTTRSGIAVATSMAPSAAEIGHIMGHEAGHFLGLFHTQEFIGYTDMIDDTGQNFAGSDNLMFPTVTSEPASLSDGQAWVLHRSPLIQPAEDNQ